MTPTRYLAHLEAHGITLEWGEGILSMPDDDPLTCEFERVVNRDE